MTSNPARIGILIASDRASSGQYQDASGPAIEAYLADVLESRWQCDYRLVPDEQTVIADTLVDLVDHSACDLILMSGGTGPAARDVTPEAMASICDRLLPGFGEEMRRASLRDVPTAILSRQEAGLRGRCLGGVLINETARVPVDGPVHHRSPPRRVQVVPATAIIPK